MNYVPGEIIVKFKTEKINLKQAWDHGKFSSFEKDNNLNVDKLLSRQNIAVLKIQSNETVEDKIKQLKSDPSVQYVQPNFVYKIQMADPNDTDFNKLRGLKNIWQNVNGTVGTSGADIRRNQAMDIFSWDGNPNVTWTIVAVIDIGTNYNHVDLINNMWSWINCLSYTGASMWWCLRGYDFYSTGDNDPFPNGTDNHGTHIAWTIGAQINNDTGIVGVNPNARIMAIRAGSGNDLTTEDVVQWIDFAKYNGARIINASRWWWASNCNGAWDEILYESIRDFPWLMIAAAGNDWYEHLNWYFSIPTDFSATTNCRAWLDNIIWVAATDQDDTLAWWSDYWSWGIHVWAPWENIYSTVLADGYGYKNGTSMATPHVVGLASLAWSYRPDLNYLDIKNAILDWWDPIASLSGKTVSWKRINVYNTLYNLTQTATGSINFLSWSRINSTWAYVRLIASKIWTYQLSWAGMIGILTWNITLTWLDIFVQLTSWDGVKNVGVIFFDNIAKQSQLYTASIILDTTKPSIPILFSPISWSNISWIVNLLRNSSVDTWWMSGYYYELSNDSGMNNLISTWIVYVTWVSLNSFSWGNYYRKIKAFDLLWWYSEFSQTWNFVLLRDSRPDLFTFNPISNSELNIEYTSDQIIISWINTGSQISIIGWTYQLNNTWNFVSMTWTIYSWDTIKIKLTSSSSYSTQVIATLTIGDINWTFTVTTKSSWWGGGGGWGFFSPTCKTVDLTCSNWKYILKSWSSCEWGNLWNSCNLNTWIIASWTITWGIAKLTIFQTNSVAQWPNIVGSVFSPELNSAYIYAYNVWITTIPNINNANMNWTLIRKHLAKMISNFAIRVLKNPPNTSIVCEFDDMQNETYEMKFYAKLACQLGLMWLDSNWLPSKYFSPDVDVSRAQFGTTLSRAIRWDKYNGWEYFYTDHLNALKDIGIMKLIDQPDNLELRWYVMLMMMRTNLANSP